MDVKASNDANVFNPIQLLLPPVNLIEKSPFEDRKFPQKLSALRVELSSTCQAE